MSQTFIDFKNPHGKNILERNENYFQWVQRQKDNHSWLIYKSNDQSPAATCSGYDESGNIISGPNFASQDYLGLSSHPQVKAAAVAAIQNYGPHSASSPSIFGRSTYYHQLAEELTDFLKLRSVLLYPTGWSAGYGVIKGLVRKYDHVIMDILAHNCLQDGAYSATNNVYLTPHLDNQAIARRLNDIRSRFPGAAILVVTESLFSMDSDVPDLKELQTLCLHYDATLLVDCAHDFGSLGEHGLGNVEAQELTDKSNLIFVGSGSKVLGTNLGFVACNSIATIEYLKGYSSSLVFSNALSPVQAAGALQALLVLKSQEGKSLRSKLMNNSIYLRKKLLDNGFTLIGSPSPIVIILIGDETLAGTLTRELLNNGVIIHHVEYPAVAKGAARIRLQLMATHSFHHLDILIEKLIHFYAKIPSIA